MLNYTITRVADAQKWDAIPAIQMNNRYLNTHNDVHASAQICYNDEALFIHLQAQVSEIRAVETGSLGNPCEDSCLEFFFQPVNGDDRYINLEFNMNGCFYLGMGTGLYDLMRLVFNGDPVEVFKPKIQETADGWEIFYQIPFSFIRRMFPQFTVAAGMQMRANCFACSDLSKQPYYLSWNLVDREPFTFHSKECFGNMVFGS